MVAYLGQVPEHPVAGLILLSSLVFAFYCEGAFRTWRLVEVAKRAATEAERIAQERSDGWEYLLFAEYLRSGRDAINAKWRDYSLGLKAVQGPTLTEPEAMSYIESVSTRPIAILHNINRLFDPAAQESAFGSPGEPGSPDAIAHHAERIIAGYEGFIDFALEVRSLDVPEALGRYFELSSRLVEGPIAQIRAFIDDLTTELEKMSAFLTMSDDEREACGPLQLSVDLVLEMTPGLTDELSEELDVVRRHLAHEPW